MRSIDTYMYQSVLQGVLYVKKYTKYIFPYVEVDDLERRSWKEAGRVASCRPCALT